MEHSILVSQKGPTNCLASLPSGQEGETKTHDQIVQGALKQDQLSRYDLLLLRQKKFDGSKIKK